jgi:hypothetical protein
MKYPVIILCFLIAFSCKKKESPVEEVTPPNTTVTSAYTIKDYMPLKYGNYWVYEFTRTDTNNVVLVTAIDSCYVQDSTFTNGRWFYLISQHRTSAFYFADSANCIIRTDGKPELKLSNNDTIRRDSMSWPGQWATWKYVMNTNPTTFSFNSKTYYNCINKYLFFRSNLNPYCNDRIAYDTYAPGVGIVYSNFGWMNSCEVWELKLLRYKIN